MPTELLPMSMSLRLQFQLSLIFLLAIINWVYSESANIDDFHHRHKRQQDQEEQPPIFLQNPLADADGFNNKNDHFSIVQQVIDGGHGNGQQQQPHRNGLLGAAHGGCKHYCSISDPKLLGCWNDTLHFYEKILVGLLRRNIIVQANRAMWMLANQPALRTKLDFVSMVNASSQRLKQLLPRQRVEDDNTWKTADTVFERLAPVLMENVQQQVDKRLRNHYGDELPRFEVECPHGCERSWDTWKWLFMASLMVTLALFALLLFLVFVIDQKAQRAWTLEADEYSEENAVKLMKRGSQTQMRTLRVIS